MDALPEVWEGDTDGEELFPLEPGNKDVREGRIMSSILIVKPEVVNRVEGPLLEADDGGGVDVDCTEADEADEAEDRSDELDKRVKDDVEEGALESDGDTIAADRLDCALNETCCEADELDVAVEL